MPSVNGSSSSLTVFVERDGTHPSGTVLCNHRCVQAELLSAMMSAAEIFCSFRVRGVIPVILSIGLTEGKGIDCNLGKAAKPPSSVSNIPVLPFPSEKFTYELIHGVEGVEFIDTTDGGDAIEAGARTVKFRLSSVKFVA
jgi:hypothetical protein